MIDVLLYSLYRVRVREMVICLIDELVHSGLWSLILLIELSIHYPKYLLIKPRASLVLHKISALIQVQRSQMLISIILKNVVTFHKLDNDVQTNARFATTHFHLCIH